MAREHAALEDIGRRRTEDFNSEIEGNDEVRRQLSADGRASALAPTAEVLADRRLEQATALLHVAEQRLAQADARLRVADDAGREHAALELKSKLDDYSALLYDGKSDEAAEVMAHLLAERRQSEQPLDVTALKDAVKRELKLDTAMKTFAENYPEIIGDPDLAQIADRHFDAARAEGKPEAEALTEAGERTRDTIKEIAADLGMSGARSRARRASATDEPDARSVIAEMAAARPGAIARHQRGE